MRPIRLLAFVALLACLGAATYSLTVSRDQEAATGLLLGATIAVITLVAARPRKDNR